jgi:hypothetical protein
MKWPRQKNLDQRRCRSHETGFSSATAILVTTTIMVVVIGTSALAPSARALLWTNHCRRRRLPFSATFLVRSGLAFQQQPAISQTSLSQSRLFQSSRNNNNNNNGNDWDKDDSSNNSNGGYARPVVQWYPGHIAKAERLLSETLKAVDVVVEIRDARAPKATSHPLVPTWCAGRPRLVVLTHADQIPGASRKAWMQAYQLLGTEDERNSMDRQVQNQAKQAIQERLKYTTTTTTTASGTTTPRTSTTGLVDSTSVVLLVNGKLGSGIHALTRALFKAGSHVQERRERRGLKERPLRVAVIGYPNVGKSGMSCLPLCLT